MVDMTKIFASFRARQLTMTGIGRHLEKPEADILQRISPTPSRRSGHAPGGIRL
jgi:hypothetical protein